MRKDVHGVDIANEFGVSRPTVSVALKGLAEKGYIFVDGVHEGKARTVKLEKALLVK